MEENKKPTNAEKRKDYYEHTACIKNGKELITRDQAIEIILRYQVEGREDEAKDLIEQIKEVKAHAKKLFPEE